MVVIREAGVHRDMSLPATSAERLVERHFGPRFHGFFSALTLLTATHEHHHFSDLQSSHGIDYIEVEK
jgi:hypothetical protein